SPSLRDLSAVGQPREVRRGVQLRQWRQSDMHFSRDSPSRIQQFCGHAEITLPSGSVMVRSNPARDPSLARLASAVTVLLSAASTSLLLMSRARKKLGDGPSSAQLCTSVPFFVSTINSMCGFRQSILLSVPVMVIRSLKS